MTDLEPTSYDVVIIGAGINGAGLFRDLSEQGVACLILDKGDFGSGTSAAPSRMIHGGLKYLETGEFGLVAQSTYERNLLLKNAAHLVHPLPTMIPLYSWFKGVGAAARTFLGAKASSRSRGAAIVKMGLMLYDFYGRRARVMPRHQVMSRKRALSEFPSLTPRVVAMGGYYDAAVTAPERLVTELISDGLAANPASRALNWTALTGHEGGALQFTGPEGAGAAKAGIVINAAGPWIDRVNALFGINGKYIGGTKGSHIILDHPALLAELDGRMIYFEADDGRILLVYPYLGKVLVGTSDIPFDRPDEVVCMPEEIDYFFEQLRDVLPGQSFDRSQIVYTYSGIRPLPNSDGLPPRLISRDHSTPTDAPSEGRPFPVISLVGGKWTTFRGFAEEVADDVLMRLGRVRRVSTAELPIGGGRDLPAPDARPAWIARVAEASGAAPDRVETLLVRYGATADAVARAEGAAPQMIGNSSYSAEEIRWLCAHEHVVHLEDIVLRRTMVAFTGNVTGEVLAGMAEAAAAELGWDAGRMQAEIDRVKERLAARHRVTLEGARA